MYPKKCLSTFYNSYVKTIISYGLLIYGSAHKSDLENIDEAQRRIPRAIFSEKSLTALRMFTNKQKFKQITKCSLMKFLRSQ